MQGALMTPRDIPAEHGDHTDAWEDGKPPFAQKDLISEVEAFY